MSSDQYDAATGVHGAALQKTRNHSSDVLPEGSFFSPTRRVPSSSSAFPARTSSTSPRYPAGRSPRRVAAMAEVLPEGMFPSTTQPASISAPTAWTNSTSPRYPAGRSPRRVVAQPEVLPAGVFPSTMERTPSSSSTARASTNSASPRYPAGRSPRCIAAPAEASLAAALGPPCQQLPGPAGQFLDGARSRSSGSTPTANTPVASTPRRGILSRGASRSLTPKRGATAQPRSPLPAAAAVSFCRLPLRPIPIHAIRTAAFECPPPPPGASMFDAPAPPPSVPNPLPPPPALPGPPKDDTTPRLRAAASKLMASTGDFCPSRPMTPPSTPPALPGPPSDTSTPRLRALPSNELEATRWAATGTPRESTPNAVFPAIPRLSSRASQMAASFKVRPPGVKTPPTPVHTKSLPGPPQYDKAPTCTSHARLADVSLKSAASVACADPPSSGKATPLSQVSGETPQSITPAGSTPCESMCPSVVSSSRLEHSRIRATVPVEFDGLWSDNDELQGKISGNVLVLPDGTSKPLWQKRQGVLAMTFDGREVEAVLDSDGQTLTWSDGNAWTRMTSTPVSQASTCAATEFGRAAEAAKPPLVVKTPDAPHSIDHGQSKWSDVVARAWAPVLGSRRWLKTADIYQVCDRFRELRSLGGLESAEEQLSQDEFARVLGIMDDDDGHPAPARVALLFRLLSGVDGDTGADTQCTAGSTCDFRLLLVAMAGLTKTQIVERMNFAALLLDDSDEGWLSVEQLVLVLRANAHHSKDAAPPPTRQLQSSARVLIAMANSKVGAESPSHISRDGFLELVRSRPEKLYLQERNTPRPSARSTCSGKSASTSACASRMPTVAHGSRTAVSSTVAAADTEDAADGAQTIGRTTEKDLLLENAEHSAAQDPLVPAAHGSEGDVPDLHRAEQAPLADRAADPQGANRSSPSEPPMPRRCPPALPRLDLSQVARCTGNAIVQAIEIRAADASAEFATNWSSSRSDQKDQGSCAAKMQNESLTYEQFILREQQEVMKNAFRLRKFSSRDSRLLCIGATFFVVGAICLVVEGAGAGDETFGLSMTLRLLFAMFCTSAGAVTLCYCFSSLHAERGIGRTQENESEDSCGSGGDETHQQASGVNYREILRLMKYRRQVAVAIPIGKRLDMLVDP